MDESALFELERRVSRVERDSAAEISAIREQITALRTTTETAPEPKPVPVFKPEPIFADVVPTTSAPAPAQATPPPPPPAPTWIDEIDWASYFTGARGLALAGGVVSLLGIVFLFVLAVDRGWVTQGMRVGIGAAVSVALFAAAVQIMRSYGQLYAATAAAAAGIGGSYATLYAATAMYHYLPPPASLLFVAAIAIVAVSLAAVWNSEFVAGLGLISAIFAPLAVQHETTFVGLLFAAIVFGATTALLISRRWRLLMLAAWGSTGVLTCAYLLDQPAAAAGLTIAGVFGALYLAAASFSHLQRGEGDLTPEQVSIAFSTVLIELLAVHQAWGFEDWKPGVAFLVMTVACAVPAAAWFHRPDGRPMAAVLWSVALVFAGMSAAAFFSDATLALAWSIEAAALVVLAVLAREIRFQVGAAAYGLLAAGHALLLDIPPWQLFLYHEHPASGIVGPVALLGALLVGAYVLRTRSAAPAAPFTPLERLLSRTERRNGEELAWTAAAIAAHIAIAVILQLAQWLSGTESSFEWAQAVITAFVTGLGIAALLVGSRRPNDRKLWVVGLAVVGLGLVKLAFYDVHRLADDQLSLSQSLFGALILVGGYIAARIGVNNSRRAIYALLPLSAAVAGRVIVDSATGDERGWLFAALAAAYAAFVLASHIGRRDRNLISFLTAPAAIFATVAAVILVDGWWLVPVLAGYAALLLLAGRATKEPRFELYGLGFVGGVVGLSLRFARPDHLVHAVSHPSAGIGALAVAVALVALFARTLAVDFAEDELDDAFASELERLRSILAWAAATLGLYGISLLVLQLAQSVGGDSLQTGFQRGETAVSALWAAVGLTLLCVGLFKQRRAVRLGGLTLLCVALAKLFLFDLSNLSSLSRALSFLVVGAAFLGGGFVYQKLSAELAGNGRLT
jgi:uncharacterized membrane protein